MSLAASPAMYDGQEELDKLVWDKNDEDSAERRKQMRLKTTCRKVEELAEQQFGKPTTLISPLIAGGFNILYRLRLDERPSDIMVRLPFPALDPFPDEKTAYEAATAALIAHQTQLPVPRPLYYSQDSKVGPFMLMERVDNYKPITHNMSDMIRLANIPCSVLPTKEQTYETADAWSALSTFGFAEDDWSAQSIKDSASTKSPAPSGSSAFRPWGDDLRAGNILLSDSDKIAALIDWEFSYDAPTQFILDPPWWLLLETAEMWSSGVDEWRETYDRRLKTWLSAMEKAEADMVEPSPLPVPLSTYMRESWQTGRFFLSYEARKSWAFDSMYWKFLDERFFGERGSDVLKKDLWRTRVHLLSEEERIAMDSFVERKMNESKEARIVDWDSDEAKQRVSELLFD